MAMTRDELKSEGPTPDVVAHRATDRPLPSQASSDMSHSLDDLVVDPFGGPENLVGRIRNRSKNTVLGARAIGDQTQDIGEIAVLEDDGTLVNPTSHRTDSVAIVNRFYETHGDEYDELILFVASNYAFDVEPEAGFAFFQIAAGHTAGIGRFQGNPNESEGLTRLLGWCNMNDLSEYPTSFTEDFFRGVASGVEILGQEFLHEWGAFIQPQPSTGADILGRGNSHWSFFLHHPGLNNASPMEGNRWRSLGGGSFETIESFTGFGELDEYIMGLRAPKDVLPFYVIDFETPPFIDGSFPASGVVVESGTRLDLTIEDIIASHGPRLPDATTSMKTFKVAFILITPTATAPMIDDLAKLDGFRIAWEDYFQTSTENLGIMDTRLGPDPRLLSDRFALFDAEDGDLQAFFEYVQGATIDQMALNEPSGMNSLRMNGGWGGGDEVRSWMIDLSNYWPGELRLNYSLQRSGGGDVPEAGDDLVIDYFNAAGEWALLNIHEAAGIETDTTFTDYSSSVPPNGYHSQFRYRIRRLQGETQPVDDWFLDDIHLAFDPSCAADLNHDLQVDVLDLLDVLIQWGVCPVPCTVDQHNMPDNCTADTNQDCFVDVMDLLTLLALWGTCPPDTTVRSSPASYPSQ